MNISKVRSNLSAIIKQVDETKQPVIVVRDSLPSAIIYPYVPSQDKKSYEQKLLTISGRWFSKDENAKIRKEVDKKLSENSL